MLSALTQGRAGARRAAGARGASAVWRAPGVLAALLGLLLAAGTAHADIRLVDSGPGYARVLYEAPPTDSFVGASGVPTTTEALRHFVGATVVGVPPAGEVELEVLEAHVLGHVQGDLPEDLRLSGPAWLEAPSMFRDQRVVGLGFGPLADGGGTTDGGTGGQGATLYDRVLVEVRFGPAAGQAPRRDGFEGAYAATLINYQQSRGWRTRRHARPAARAAQAGVLPADGMFRCNVRSEGIYRVDGAALEAAGADLRSIDPARIRVLYGGGRDLGLSRMVSRGVLLIDIGAVVEDGGDGRFDEDDTILFYGQPLERWEYSARHGYTWRRNLQTRDNVYFIDLAGDSDGARPTVVSGAPGTAPVVDRYRERVHEEDERLILRQLLGINSGYDWYWDTFSGNARNFTFVVDDAVAGAPANVRIAFYGWTSQVHQFDLRWNDENLGRYQFAGAEIDTLVAVASDGAAEGLNQLGLVHRDLHATRLDFYEIDYVRRLQARGGELVFDWPAAADGGVSDDGTRARFEVGGFAADGGVPRVFEVTDGLHEIVDADYDAATGQLTFEAERGSQPQPPRYVVAQAARWKRPAGLVRDTQQRLRDPGLRADYLVISHADFLPAARRLAAWRGVDDRFGEPFTSLVVDVQDIYDEFSGGLLDPMAIRAFIRYAVDNWDLPPVYVTLMGDGTYDSKNNSGVSHRNWIPAYQDGESTYDEWYVRMGPGNTPDLAIGRLPVQTPDEAEAVVDKIIAYDREPLLGPWQARIILVADDVSNPQRSQDFESYFLSDAEFLARKQMPLDLDLTKLYIGAYPLEGRTKPRARDEFIRLFNEGALILTYLGHGNPEVLAHEQIFLLSRDLASIDNGRRLPFIYTAASQVGVFDDPARESMPEALVKMPAGGAIGFISATRVGFHNSNMILARQFHQQMYRSGRRDVPVGLALMEAKQLVKATAEQRINIQRYSLIGDPAQRLNRPRYSVTLSLPDTLEALMEVDVEGQVVDAAGAPRPGFDGVVTVRAFDSAALSQIEGLAYQQVGAPMFRGQVPVTAGRFQARFRVPKDITYRANAGRISAYATAADGNSSAFGSRASLVLEGTAAGVADDGTGPQIELGFAGQTGFRSGDFVAPEPVLAARLTDPAGINITGETGHEIEAWIDGQVTAVTRFFTSDADYRKGTVRYPLGALEPGEHTVRLKAWDAFNNSAQTAATFVVAEAADAALAQVLFHPNPSPDGTGSFVYTLTAAAAQVRIAVFALSGRRVADVEGSTGLGYNQVRWAPADLANGTYYYRLEASLEAGGTAQRDGWIQVLR